MKLQLDQWDEILREKEKKLKEWVSTREVGSWGKEPAVEHVWASELSTLLLKSNRDACGFVLIVPALHACKCRVSRASC